MCGSCSMATWQVGSEIVTPPAFFAPASSIAGLRVRSFVAITCHDGFDFQAAIPLTEPPKGKPAGAIKVGQSPEGRALKFVHRGTYDEMNQTYEAITNYLDEKQLEAKDLFIEEYVTDPVTTPEDKLVINIYVPIK